MYVVQQLLMKATPGNMDAVQAFGEKLFNRLIDSAAAKYVQLPSEDELRKQATSIQIIFNQIPKAVITERLLQASDLLRLKAMIAQMK